MEIRILLFGLLAEHCNSNEIVLSNATNTDEVRAQFAKQFPTLSGIKYFISVNRNIINTNTSIDPNSEVALLPPFSGG